MENLAAREAMLDVAASYEHLEDIARAHLQSLSAAQQPSRRHQIASSDPNPYDKKPVWD